MRTRSHQIIYYVAECVCVCVRASTINQNKKPIFPLNQQNLIEGRIETITRLLKVKCKTTTNHS